MHEINIPRDFTDAPGGRLKTDGNYSGEEFREKFLEDYFTSTDQEQIRIIFDGAYGYATSFLEEAFGGLARKFGREKVKSRFIFISNEEPLLLEEITNYINDCCENGK